MGRTDCRQSSEAEAPERLWSPSCRPPAGGDGTRAPISTPPLLQGSRLPHSRVASLEDELQSSLANGRPCKWYANGNRSALHKSKIRQTSQIRACSSRRCSPMRPRAAARALQRRPWWGPPRQRRRCSLLRTIAPLLSAPAPAAPRLTCGRCSVAKRLSPMKPSTCQSYMHDPH